MCERMYTDNVFLCSKEEEKNSTNLILLENKFVKLEIDKLKHKNKKKKKQEFKAGMTKSNQIYKLRL